MSNTIDILLTKILQCGTLRFQPFIVTASGERIRLVTRRLQSTLIKPFVCVRNTMAFSGIACILNTPMEK